MTNGAAHGPWVDVHAHPGACFLRGIPSDHLGHQQFGGDRSELAEHRMRRGSVTVASFATVSDAHVIGLTRDGRLGALRDFEPDEAHRSHLRQVNALRELCEITDLRPVLDSSDIAALHAHNAIGMWMTCEGGDFVETNVDRIHEAYELGVRSVTLVHYRINALGDIQTEAALHGGLTNVGRDVVREMNKLGMIIDMAHATMATTEQAAAESAAPIMISHSHLATPGADHPRLLSPAHAQLVAETGGVVGAWPAGIACHSLGEYVDEICRLVDCIGIDAVAIGTDMDANFMPALTDYDQFASVAELLATRGMSGREVDQVLGGNFIRMWQDVEACRVP